MKDISKIAIAAMALLSIHANGGVVVNGFDANSLAANDDGSTGQVPIGFSQPIRFFGESYSVLYVNNNGNVTFDSPLSTYTPFGLAGTSRKIIAPFFADVDTRGLGSGLTRYGSGTFEGHPTFGVTWRDVGYFGQHTDKLNTFQLLLVDRSDVSPGDFDIRFNYDRIEWETGDASGGTNGFGGTSAAVGYSNGLSGNSNVSLELPGSRVPGAFLDVNSTFGLNRTTNTTNGSTGIFEFAVRNGIVITPPPIPEPSTLCFAVALLFVPASRYRRARTIRSNP